MRAVQCYVRPTLFYGAETWTITKSLLFRRDAFEMWIVYHSRVVLKSSWTENIANEEVLRRRGTSRVIVRQFKTINLSYNNSNNNNNNSNNNNNGRMAVFNVAGYLMEERRIWPIIKASPRGQCSK